jgi:hypothetical protein
MWFDLPTLFWAGAGILSLIILKISYEALKAVVNPGPGCLFRLRQKAALKRHLRRIFQRGDCA